MIEKLPVSQTVTLPAAGTDSINDAVQCARSR